MAMRFRRARSPLQANCAMLARMGCVVFQYDMVGYCDSQAIPHRQGFLDAQAVLRLQSFMGLQTWNSIRAVDFVLSLPEVDPDRIAVTGASSGGTQTIALSIVDPRIAAAFPAVMVSMRTVARDGATSGLLWGADPSPIRAKKYTSRPVEDMSDAGAVARATGSQKIALGRVFGSKNSSW